MNERCKHSIMLSFSFHRFLDLLKGGIQLKGGIEQASIVLVFEYSIPKNIKGRTPV